MGHVLLISQSVSSGGEGSHYGQPLPRDSRVWTDVSFPRAASHQGPEGLCPAMPKLRDREVLLYPRFYAFI